GGQPLDVGGGGEPVGGQGASAGHLGSQSSSQGSIQNVGSQPASPLGGSFVGFEFWSYCSSSRAQNPTPKGCHI
ncbi:hypothetical protein A2U01_0104303, partial [Trifolium medium]|nr:hypothetical protein [Trifolium medium]